MNRSLIKYLAALLLFGSNGIVASMITMSSYEIVMFRTCIGSVLLLLLFLFTGNRFSFYKQKRSFLFLSISGIAMGTSWMFLYEAYRLIGVSIASLGYYCGPVMVMAVSPFLFKEKITLQKLTGILVVLVGIVLVNLNAFRETHTGFGIFCALMSALMYALMVTFNKKATKIAGMENATLQLTVAFFTVFLFVLFRQGLRFEVAPDNLVPLLFLGLVNTGVGCYLYFSSIGNLNVQTVAILGYLEPLSAVIFSVLFLHEAMVPIQVAGAIMVLGGAIGAELQLPGANGRKKREKRTQL